MSKTIFIKKASGEIVPFSKQKLQYSLKKAGADEERIQQIIAEIEKELHDGTTTKEIYKKAFFLLKKKDRSHAARYHLKRGIQQLGPTGFPFEKYLSEILNFQGYTVKTNQFVQGHCVSHEIDIIAKNDHHQFMIECKFHSQSGVKCDVKIPLYVHSRFQDVEKNWKKISKQEPITYQAWIATNTQFTKTAIEYGNCIGMYMLGWNYPKKESLKDRIDQSGLYPVTCLTTLTGREKQALLAKSIVLAKDLSNGRPLLKNLNISDSRIEKITEEAKALCFSSKYKNHEKK